MNDFISNPIEEVEGTLLESVAGEAYTFSDVLIVPKYSEIESRRNVDLSSDFGNFKIGLPVFSANMKAITGSQMAIAMAKSEGMGILHRFCSIEQSVQDFIAVKQYFEDKEITVTHNSCSAKEAFPSSIGNSETNYCFEPMLKKYSNKVVGVSIGVQEEDKDRFGKLYEVGARIFCIDIAHGHCKLMKNIISWIKSQNLKDIHIIAGNVATVDGAYDLCEWGASSVKIGIGPGSACLTRKNTGVGVPQLYALESISEDFRRQGIKDIKIIADGGLSSTGDIAKCLKYAHAACLGSMLSGVTETPGNVFTNDKGEFYKTYMGSASGENKTSNGNANEFVEGVAKTVPFRGHVKHVLKNIKDGLQSAFSYVGARNLEEFQQKCEFVRITSGGRSESKI